MLTGVVPGIIYFYRMNSEVRTVTINDEEFTFVVVNDLTEPCPQCGVPACGKEAYLWKEKDEQKITLVFDGGLFGVFGTEFFTNHPEVFSRYQKLPQFLKDWNEGTGWDELSDDKACSISVHEVLQSMEIMQAAGMPDWIKSDFMKYYTAVMELARKHGEQGSWYILKT